MLKARFDNQYGQLAASKKCCRRFGFLDDTLDHCDRLDGLHRSFCPVLLRALTLHLRESKASGQACCLGLLAEAMLAKPSAALLLALPLALMYFAEPNRFSPSPFCCPLALQPSGQCPAAGQHPHCGPPFFPLLTGFGLDIGQQSKAY